MKIPPLRFLFVLSLLALLGTGSLFAQEPPRQSARLLIFGNSFSANSTKHLAALAQAGGKDLYFLNLVKGGCSLQEHATAVKAAETDPESTQARFYAPGGTAAKGFAGKKKINALEGAEAGPWDFVSIQQFSVISYKPETYEPHARQLVDFIRAKMPNAQIVVHETWAYRPDDPLFRDGSFTPEKMHEQLRANYQNLARTYNAQFLPIGDAFWAAGKTPEWTYEKDPTFDFKNPPPGTLPVQKGSLHVGWLWKKADANTVTPDSAPSNDPNAAKKPSAKLVLDGHHANAAGEYLGSCVWYEFLFNDDVTRLTSYTPPNLTPQQAESLRKIAHETVAAQRAAKTP